MKSIWNKRHPSMEIKTNNLKEIWDTLGNYLQNSCRNEACWMKTNLFKSNFTDKEIKSIFAPKQPKEWKKIQMNGYQILKY